ncbi:glutathione S-transferase family protein [Sphingopyxis sp.]|uniref:glutathione S-transferase family protein n=1 Tax=Sphingopyxis sp. TaxID=1908224 RepID=UPI002D782A6B|nr:glutathione S-transferase family protein [Sphingopyxis sp.]HET6524323.1 glutathione S-transferase family protein [Sphingopyxis sp.]
MKPLLYSGTKNASSWAMRAWLALREAGVAFDEEVVDIRRPQRFANLERIGAFSPPAMVPVLVDDQMMIFDSVAIMEYANDIADGALLPADRATRARARSLVAWQHSGLSGICTRISFESAFYPLKRTLTDAERTECGRLFDYLDQVLELSGGPYLFGALSLADLMLVPTVVRLTRHDLDFASWSRSQRWTAALLERASVAEWMREADALPHIWFDDYLVPGDAIRMVPAAA